MRACGVCVRAHAPRWDRVLVRVLLSRRLIRRIVGRPRGSVPAHIDTARGRTWQMLKPVLAAEHVFVASSQEQPTCSTQPDFGPSVISLHEDAVEHIQSQLG